MEAQQLHRTHSTSLLATITVTDIMRICLFYETTYIHQKMPLHGDSIYMYIHCSNTQLRKTHDASNTDTTTTLTYLGIFFQYAPYQQTNGKYSFPEFLSTLLHQYDDNTQHEIIQLDPSLVQPYQHTTLESQNHCSTTSNVIHRGRLQPSMTPDSPYFMLYTHGLVSTLPPENYSRATMNIIDHPYIGILSWYSHTTIRHHFSKLVTQQ